VTITGEDVRRARGSESRKSFSQRVGITEAKIAGIEKGRKIRPEELTLLEAAGITGSNGDTPLLDRAGVTEQTTNAATTQISNTATVATRQVKSAPKPRIKTSKDKPIELLDFELDAALDDLEDDSPFGLVTLEPLQPPRELTFREMAPDGARLVSNSEIQTYKRCKRKWMLAFYKGLQKRSVRRTGHLEVGTKAHAALAAYYTPEGEPSTDPRDALERILVEAWTVIEGEVQDEVVLQSLAPEFKKDANLLRAMIEGYVQWLEETGSDEDLEVIAPEESLVLPFPVRGETATPVFITGRLDVRMRRRSDGARLFMDHKTVGDFTSPGRWLHMNPQMRHYHLLEVMTSLRDRIEAGDGIHYEVERTDGALYNMLRKVLRTERANPPFYQRLEVRHNKHDLAAYERQLRGIIQDMLLTQAQLDAGYDEQEVAYPTPNDTCAWSCDFFAVCPMHDDGSRYQQMIEDVYVTHDPYDRYPELIR
jgi:hypothetical protein